MRRVLFHIGSYTVYSYGMMIFLGIVCAYLTAEFRAKKRGLNSDNVFDMSMLSVIGGAVGAKLLFYIVEIKAVIANPSILLQIKDGFVVYGGIIGGIISCLIYCKKKKLDPAEWFDLIIPEIAIAQAFGRIGCLLAGCCYGAETTSAFHIVFTSSDYAPNNVWLYPTQIMSAMLNLLNFVLLTQVIARLTKKKGVVTACYLIFYSIGRFVIEFFRGDLERGAVGALSTSQFISIFILIAGIALLIICLKQNVTYAPESAARTDSQETTKEAEMTQDAESMQKAETVQNAEMMQEQEAKSNPEQDA